jgi:glycosyltransferase involved in cell wall biosynthesis
VSESSPAGVLHLLWSGTIGGIERTVEALVGRAPRHRALLLDGRGAIGDALIAAGRADRIGMRGGADALGLARLAFMLRRRAPRVVHVETHALLALVTARLALPKASWVYTEQSPRILESDAKFRLLYRLLRAARARLVAPSQAVAQAMRRHLTVGAEVTVVPNPCALPLAHDGSRPLGDPPVLGVVARLEPQKRVDLLLDVMAALRRGGTRTRGLVVGAGSCAPALHERASELGLAAEVELAGSQTDVAPWLDRLDIFLATSASEPYGIAAVEAMARRVPVVAMPCPGGLAELATEGGLLLPDRRVETAAAAIARLLASDEARAALRERGARFAARTTPEAILRQLEPIYDAAGD